MMTASPGEKKRENPPAFHLTRHKGLVRGLYGNFQLQ